MSTLSVDTITGQTTAANVKLPQGCIVQTTHGTLQTLKQTTSTSFVASDIKANITPKFSTSKILIQVRINGIHPNAHSSACGLAIYKGIEGGSMSLLKEFENAAGYWHSNDNAVYGVGSSYDFLDSAIGNTSNNRFEIYYKRVGGSGIMYLNNYAANSVTNSCVTLMEIAQ